MPFNPLVYQPVDFTGLDARLRDYALKFNPDIYEHMIEGSIDNLNDFVLYPIDDEFPLPTVEMAEILQPGGSDDVNPTQNAVVMKSRTLKLQQQKADVFFQHSKIEGLHRSLWVLINKAKRDATVQLPKSFEGYLMKTYSEKFIGDFVAVTLWKGIWATTGTAINGMDGFLSVLASSIGTPNEGVPAAHVATIDPLGINELNGYDEVMKVVKLIKTNKPSLISKPLICYLGEDALLDFNTQRANLPGIVSSTRTEDQTYHITHIPGFKNITFKPQVGLNKTNAVIITTPDNFCVGYDNLGRLRNIDVQKQDRLLKLFLDTRFGCQFKTGQVVFMNDWFNL